MGAALMGGHQDFTEAFCRGIALLPRLDFAMDKVFSQGPLLSCHVTCYLLSLSVPDRPCELDGFKPLLRLFEG